MTLLGVILLGTIQGTENCLHCGKFDIRICCSSKECFARRHLDLDIGDSLCFGSFLERVLCISEHLKLGYIILVERLDKSVNGAVATAMQFAHDTINRDAGRTCDYFRSNLS